MLLRKKGDMKKLRNRVSLFKDYILGRPVLKGMPAELTIETTTRCNLRCPMCPRRELSLPNADMDFDLFKKIVDETKDYLEFIWLHGYGEPLLCPDIFKMISYCHSNKIQTAISTNATVLSAEKSELLIKSGLDYIIFSIDGATKETYEKYRVGANYEQVIKNIQSFLKKKKELRSSIFCVAQMVLLEDNKKEVKQYRSQWSIPGIDEIRVKVDEFPDNRLTSHAKNVPERKIEACGYLWRGSQFVQYDGKVYCCCWTRSFQPIGDLKKNTFQEIWNNERMIQIRKNHAQGKAGKISFCKVCCVPKPNRVLNAGAFIINGFSVRKLIPFFEKLFVVNKIPLLKK